MAECKAAKSPFLSGIKMHEFGNSPLVDITLYGKLVGILLYLLVGIFHLLQKLRCSTGLNGSNPEQMNNKG